VDKKRKKGEKPLDEAAWESRVKGKGEDKSGDKEKGKEVSEKMRLETDEAFKKAPGKALTPNSVKSVKPGATVTYRTDLTSGKATVVSNEGGALTVKSEKGDLLKFGPKDRPLDRLKAEKPKASFKKHYRPKMESVMTKHELTDDDAKQVMEFSVDRPKKGKPQSPEELKRRFMQNAKPETKERMKNMSPADFMIMLRAVLDQEEGGMGKAASLRSGLIRLAYANPDLRSTLLPLLADNADR